ncbi:MAG: hypothetical protein JW838_08120 [Spirochaetes bacterium]|nr:hypothetical protein [Spirochaetota bacterium]
MTLDIYEPFEFAQGKFMARILFYLPDKHSKAMRYYRIYTHGIKNELDWITRKTWTKAIQGSFDTDPENWPECGAQMIESFVYAYFADREWRKLWKTHLLVGGYFRMKRGP